MISYVIAGSSSNPKLAEVENLCIKMKGTYRDIQFKIIAKHEAEWNDYIRQICRIYGFKVQLDPICFTPQGKLIGDAEQFKKYLINFYKASELPHDPEDNTNTELNEKLATEDYDWRNREITLDEVLENRFQRLLFKDRFQFDKELFEKVDVGKVNVYSKYLERYTPELIINPIKKISKEYLKVDDPIFNIEEAVRHDRNNTDEEDDEVAELEDVGPTKEKIGRISTQKSIAGDKSPTSRIGKRSLAGSVAQKSTDEVLEEEQKNPSDNNEVAIESSENSSPPNENGKSIEGGNEKVASEVIDSSQIKNEVLEEGFAINEEDKGPTEEEIAQMQVRKECLDKIMMIHPTFKNLREWMVKRLPDGYLLALHPEPIFKKHCLLIRDDKFVWSDPIGQNYRKIMELDNEDMAILDLEERKREALDAEGDTKERRKEIRFFDFSTTTKMRYSLDIEQVVIEEKGLQENDSNLNSKFFDPFCPFTSQDIIATYSLIQDLEAYALYRVPGIKEHDFREFLNYCIHIVKKDSLLEEATLLSGNTFRTGDIDFEPIIKDHLINIASLRQQRELQKKLDLEIEANERKVQEIKALIEEKKKASKKRPSDEDELNKSGEGKKETEEDNQKLEEELNSSKANSQHPNEDEVQYNLENEPLEECLVKDEEEVPEEVEEEENPYLNSIYLIPSWKTPHVMFRAEEGDFPPPSELIHVIYNMVRVLHEENPELDPHLSGYTYIMHTNFLLITSALKPYITYGETELFLDAWSFLGYFTFPNFERLWPQTADMEHALLAFKIKSPITLL